MNSNIITIILLFLCILIVPSVLAVAPPPDIAANITPQAHFNMRSYYNIYNVLALTGDSICTTTGICLELLSYGGNSSWNETYARTEFDTRYSYKNLTTNISTEWDRLVRDTNMSSNLTTEWERLTRDTDTNASTACDNGDTLLGNGTCRSIPSLETDSLSFTNLTAEWERLVRDTNTTYDLNWAAGWHNESGIPITNTNIWLQKNLTANWSNDPWIKNFTGIKGHDASQFFIDIGRTTGTFVLRNQSAGLLDQYLVIVNRTTWIWNVNQFCNDANTCYPGSIDLIYRDTNMSANLTTEWDRLTRDMNTSNGCTDGEVRLGNGTCRTVPSLEEGTGGGNSSWNETYARGEFDTRYSYKNLTTNITTEWDRLVRDTNMSANLTAEWERLTRDTNASTACDGAEVLLGNGSCRMITNISYNRNNSYEFGLFRGGTVSTYNGNMSNHTHVGYQRADARCSVDYAGSHMCQESEIIRTNEVRPNAGYTGQYWTKKGAPGFTANAKDCAGFTETTNNFGPYWDFDLNAGVGYGQLTVCASTLKIACCGGE